MTVTRIILLVILYHKRAARFCRTLKVTRSQSSYTYNKRAVHFYRILKVSRRQSRHNVQSANGTLLPYSEDHSSSVSSYCTINAPNRAESQKFVLRRENHPMQSGTLNFAKVHISLRQREQVFDNNKTLLPLPTPSAF